MPKIEILEKDMTTPSAVGVSNEVVYIPGLVNVRQFIETVDDETFEVTYRDELLPVNTPTLFTTVAEFKYRCGTSGVTATECSSFLDVFGNTRGFDPLLMPVQDNEEFFSKDTVDYGYTMAVELLNLGIPVLYERVNDPDAVEVVSTDASGKYMYDLFRSGVKDLYTAGSSLYSTTDIPSLADKGTYDVKYLTFGGYPTLGYGSGSWNESGTAFTITGQTISPAMIALALNRGDCVALIDPPYNPDLPVNTSDGSLYSYVNTAFKTYVNGEGSYGALFTDWCKFDLPAAGVSGALMAPSFAYLKTLATSIRTNASWLAVAGVARGLVSNLSANGVVNPIPNSVADAMQDDQDVSINPITYIRPYGNVIWGNRTLKYNSTGTTATSFLNIRNMLSDIKKLCYSAAKGLVFEQNTEILWLNFKSKIVPTLDKLQSGFGISGYKILRNPDHPNANDPKTITAKIILYPVYAVENFFIDIILQDGEVTVQ